MGVGLSEKSPQVHIQHRHEIFHLGPQQWVSLSNVTVGGASPEIKNRPAISGWNTSTTAELLYPNSDFFPQRMVVTNIHVFIHICVFIHIIYISYIICIITYVERERHQKDSKETWHSLRILYTFLSGGCCSCPTNWLPNKSIWDAQHHTNMAMGQVLRYPWTGWLSEYHKILDMF